MDHRQPVSVDEALMSRRSVRAFLSDPVPEDALREILTLAARAPSGTNMQPWKAYVATGGRLAELSEAIMAARRDSRKRGFDEFKYYPDTFFEPYLSRRRSVGFGLYGLLGIGRRETDRMHAQHDRNFVFFDAPVGMIFTIDRRLEAGSWIDHGMFLQSIMIAARARGLHPCPQAAFAPYHREIRAILPIAEEEIVLCGMALGYEDETKPENALRTERASLDEFVTFCS